MSQMGLQLVVSEKDVQHQTLKDVTFHLKKSTKTD